MKKDAESLTILSISSTSFILVLGNSMLLPILPEMKHDLHLSQVQASLILSIFSIAGAVSIPFIGYLSDQYSRKKIILFSLILYGFGGLVAGAASVINQPFSYEFIIFGRLLQGIGSAGTAPIAMAITADIFSGNKQLKVLGFIEAGNSLGKVLSPIIGAFIAAIMWYYVFFTFPIACLVIFGLFFYFVNDQKKNATNTSITAYFQKLLHVFKQNSSFLITAYAAGALCLFYNFGLLFYASDVLENLYDTHGFLNGLFLSLPLLFLTVASFTTGSIIGRYQKHIKQVVPVCFFLLAICLFILTIASSLWLTLVILSFISTCIGVILPCLNGFISNSVQQDARGFITAIYGSVRFIGIALGPLIFGYFMEKSIGTIFILSAILGLLQSFFCLLYLSDDNRSSPRQYVSSWLSMLKLSFFKGK